MADNEKPWEELTPIEQIKKSWEELTPREQIRRYSGVDPNDIEQTPEREQFKKDFWEYAKKRSEEQRLKKAQKQAQTSPADLFPKEEK